MSSLFDKVTEKEEQKTPKAEKKAVKASCL